MAFKMTGHTLPGPYRKKTGKPDVKDVLSYLENDGIAQTSKEASVAIGAADEFQANIVAAGDKYRYGATEDEKAQEAEHREKAKAGEKPGSILGNLKNK
tara:strand:+ start:508 stop:804 length:297 start_codon:yes stop_codon:yes gene_type:complete